jgi:hypothetical protein
LARIERRLASCLAVPLLFAASAATAQTAPAPQTASATPAPAVPVAPVEEIDFSADRVS